jgi:hypothetical protein
MRKLTKTGLMGTAGIGAVALAVTGFALPASADDTTTTTSSDETHTSVEALESLDVFQTWINDFIATHGNNTNAGNVGVDGGVVNGPLVSDVANGPILSGNDVSAPVGSGNDVSVEAPVGSGNEVGNGNNVGNGNTGVGDVGAEVGDLTSNIGTDVSDLVGDVSSDVDSIVGGLLD